MNQDLMKMAFPVCRNNLIMTINYDFLQKEKTLQWIFMADLEISRHWKLVCNLVSTDTFNTKIDNWDTKNANIFKEIRRPNRAAKDL